MTCYSIIHCTCSLYVIHSVCSFIYQNVAILFMRKSSGEIMLFSHVLRICLLDNYTATKDNLYTNDYITPHYIYHIVTIYTLFIILTVLLCFICF